MTTFGGRHARTVVWSCYLLTIAVSYATVSTLVLRPIHSTGVSREVPTERAVAHSRLLSQMVRGQVHILPNGASPELLIDVASSELDMLADFIEGVAPGEVRHCRRSPVDGPC